MVRSVWQGATSPSYFGRLYITACGIQIMTHFHTLDITVNIHSGLGSWVQYSHIVLLSYNTFTIKASNNCFIFIHKLIINHFCQGTYFTYIILINYSFIPVDLGILFVPQHLEGRRTIVMGSIGLSVYHKYGLCIQGIFSFLCLIFIKLSEENDFRQTQERFDQGPVLCI